ncbi:MAG: hypothetical protein CFE44_01420 [Burkholderiales bacterium PBB4]|nr:MAG: hypothetical protein CFE44_01420 [Burkholderiales bacterium PBB4]
MNAPTAPSRTARPAAVTRALAEFPDLAAKATEYLCGLSASFSLAPNEASSVVALMRVVHYAAGTTLFKAGDENSGYMLLVLDGNIAVDTGNTGSGQSAEISTLGPSALIGELALLDGSPRSATCTAVTNVAAAGFSVAGLQRLMETVWANYGHDAAGVRPIAADCQTRRLKTTLLSLRQRGSFLGHDDQTALFASAETLCVVTH